MSGTASGIGSGTRLGSGAGCAGAGSGIVVGVGSAGATATREDDASDAQGFSPGPPQVGGAFVNDGNEKSNRYSGASLLNCTFAVICAGSAAVSMRASKYPARGTS